MAPAVRPAGERTVTGTHDDAVDRALDALSLPRHDLGGLPDSPGRFPDGAPFRFEIPSTEGPECLDAVLEQAAALDVPIHRVSQGSGVFMLTDDELGRMATRAASASVEVSLFARPCAAWGPSASARAPGGAALRSAAWGQEQIRFAAQDVLRAADHGFRSVLIADLGLLTVFDQMKLAGDLPPDMQAKVSVMLPAANPAAARAIERLGAGTLNVPSDLSLAQIAAIRAAVGIPLDVYVEAPDDLGGFVRFHEVPELIRVAAPVHVKLGLRNAPDLYPSGAHLGATAVAMSRERVRRARLVLELVDRSGTGVRPSGHRPEGLAVPVPPEPAGMPGTRFPGAGSGLG